jgi:microcystin degradation protein MlrC
VATFIVLLAKFSMFVVVNTNTTRTSIEIIAILAINSAKVKALVLKASLYFSAKMEEKVNGFLLKNFTIQKK